MRSRDDFTAPRPNELSQSSIDPSGSRDRNPEVSRNGSLLAHRVAMLLDLWYIVVNKSKASRLLRARGYGQGGPAARQIQCSTWARPRQRVGFLLLLLWSADWVTAMNERPRRANTKLILDSPPLLCREDWGEAIDVGTFYGRKEELAALEQWITTDHCRLVAIVGLGGIGKTSLAVKLAQHIQLHFDYLFWRDLRNAPLIDDILGDALRFLSDQQQVDLPQGADKRISLLMDYLRRQRCLLVLDNIEAILCEGERAGGYRDGFEGYGQLVQRMGEMGHASCLVLTSRERLREVAALEGRTSPVRSWQLSGLGQVECQEILRDKDLFGPEDSWASLIEHYRGSPLALKIVSATIRDLFGGDIVAFLDQGAKIVGDLSDLLGQQFTRLSALEKEIMYWLAIEREAVSLEPLRENLVLPHAQQKYLEACESLRRRSLIERTDKPVLFTLQPVVMEFATSRLIDEVCQEIDSGKIAILNTHALVKAQAKDYVRASQLRLVLRPVVANLIAASGREGTENRLRSVLAAFRNEHPRCPGYFGGNVMNLLVEVKGDLSGYDFSHMTVWQAYLCGVDLHRVSLAHSDLARSAFTETFGSIVCTAFSPDGKLFAAGASNGETRVWRVGENAQVFVGKGHTDCVRSVAFSPDGNILASGSSDHTVRLWDPFNGQTLKTFSHEDRVRSIAFSPDSRILASGSEDRSVCLWDVKTGQRLNTLRGHNDRIWSVAFHPEGTLLATGSDDRIVHLWNAHSGQVVHTLEHTHEVRSVAFSPDGRVLASGGKGAGLQLWDCRTAECIKTLLGHAETVWSVAFSPDGLSLASGSEDQTVRLWNVSTGECTRVLSGHSNWVWAVAFSPDGQVLASGSEDRTLRLWDTRTGQCSKCLHGYMNWTLAVAYSPDGCRLASGSTDGKVRLWDPRSGKCLKTLHAHSNAVRTLQFSPDGAMLASGSDDRTIRLWDVRSWEHLQTLRGQSGRVRSLAFRADGRILASTGAEDQDIRLWDVSMGQCLRSLIGHANRIESVVFSPDGCMLASAAQDQTVHLWDVDTGECLHSLRGHTNWVWCVAFSPDSQMVASCGDDRTVMLWDVRKGKAVETYQHTNRVWAVAFSPNGRLLASGGNDGMVQLRDIRTGQCWTLQGHTDAVLSVTFSPDGATLASGSDDETIRLWSARTGKCLRVLRSARPYEQMDITGAIGLTAAQRSALKALGAVEREETAVAEGVEPERSVLGEGRGNQSSTKTRGIHCDPETGHIMLNGREVTLQLSEEQRKLVRFLFSRKGATCTKDEIALEIWGDIEEGMSDSAIYELVKRVRQKMEEDWRHPRYIVTVPGEGYRLE